ncbi:hypothetical protein C1H46_013138 [Malus baccata]|uniref:peroxidase n=1 Tax=Malus baccata TaxID=106549 RepID=A0A540MR29_MALBA|nr:hypothetical protein C1H46_013138 [Malus baccata]
MTSIIHGVVEQAQRNDTRVGAKLIWLHFHDYFVNNGGPSWEVQLGRRDSRTANRTGADHDIPTPQDNLKLITEKFRNKGLDSTDLVALSGAHTFGQAKCRFFDDRLYNFNGTSKPNLTIDVEYMKTLSQTCSQGGKPSTLTKQLLMPLTTTTTKISAGSSKSIRSCSQQVA